MRGILYGALVVLLWSVGMTVGLWNYRLLFAPFVAVSAGAVMIVCVLLIERRRRERIRRRAVKTMMDAYRPIRGPQSDGRQRVNVSQPNI